MDTSHHSTGTRSDELLRLATAARGLDAGHLPAELAQRLRQRVLDTLACLVAGYGGGISSELAAYAAAQPSRPEATLLPGGGRTSTSLAAFVHASLIHGLELSDVAPRGTVHPGNEIIPCALAIAERDGIHGRDVLPAIAAGYETEIRIGRAIFPRAFYRGWWTPGLLAPVGPAVTAAHLMGLDAERIADAVGIALSLAPAATEHGCNQEGATFKWLVGGQACCTGMMAAEMAARGVTGMRHIGTAWLPVMSEEVHAQRLTEGLADDGGYAHFELLNGLVTKFFATVGPAAGPLEALFRIIGAHGVRHEAVEAIEVECTKRAALFDARHPQGEVTARTSLPYAIAAAVYTGDEAALLGPAFRLEVVRNPVLAALEDRVRIVENLDFERQYPARSLARVTVTLRDGRSFSEQVDRAGPGRYLFPTDEDIALKFRRIAAPVLGAGSCNRVIELASRFDELASCGELMAALQPPPPPR
jgi:2-methylcitrate dehydratase PrpD